MSAITPDSYVKLVRFDVTKEHQITFSDLTTQLNYFENLNGLELQASTYQRKEGKVRFPAVIDELEQYNYLIYRNESDTQPNYYNDKTFFCYITNMEYINDNMTEITILQDVFQTWQFDFIYKQSFVEREHVNNDTIGVNTVAENLETGEYIINSREEVNELVTTGIMIQTTEYIAETSKPLALNYGGVYMAGGAYYVRNMNEAVSILQALQSATGTSVYNVYLTPAVITNNEWENDVLKYPRTIAST